MAALGSIEEMLASIPGIRKGGDGAAPAPRAGSEPEAAPASKRARKGGKADAAAPAPAASADAPAPAPAPAAPVHTLSLEEVVTVLECPSGEFRCDDLNAPLSVSEPAPAAAPPGCVGQLIGKGGYTIKSIQGLSGARIDIAKDAVGATTREVTIRGAAPCVAVARSMVEATITAASAPKPGRGGPAGDAAAPAEPRVELRLPCAVDRIGWVIGAGGATVKAIRTLSGAHIDMLEEVTATGGRRGVIVVSGAAAEVEEAKTALGGLLGADSAGSKAYAAQLVEAAAKRVAWDAEQRRAAAGPSGAATEGGEGSAAAAAGGECAAGAAAPPAQQAEQGQQAGWKQVVTKHPDGSELRYWMHEASGVCRW